MFSPRITIGLPVYNGERYLAAALESLLSQTYTDFEILVSDNASTDSTADIVTCFALRDDRIRVLRSPENQGSVWNFNNVFRYCRTPYFTWAAHDDVRSPEYLERCIEVLDRDPSIALCYSRGTLIDASGAEIRRFIPGPDLACRSAADRLHNWLFEPHLPYHAFFGVVRSSVLEKTPLLASSPDNDELLLMQLLLLGPFYEVGEYLFGNRDHTDRASRACRVNGNSVLVEWLNPANSGKPAMPHWDRFAGVMRMLARTPMAMRQKLVCLWLMCRWCSWRSRALRTELAAAFRRRTAHTLLA